MNIEKVKNVLVVGSGVMGNSIAQTFAVAGNLVRLIDVDGKALERAMNLIDSSLTGVR